MEAAGTAAASADAAKPLTPEEEALRRNTDCVYFLASPLTCKKVNTAAPIALFLLPPSWGFFRGLVVFAIRARNLVRRSGIPRPSYVPEKFPSASDEIGRAHV